MSNLKLEEFNRLGKAYFDQRAKYETAKALANEEYARLESLERQVMTAMEEHDMKSAKIPGCGGLTLKINTSYKIPRTAEDREAFFDYLKSKGIFDQMISVNSQTLNSFAKAEFEASLDEGNVDFKIPGLSDPVISTSIAMKRE